MIYEVDEMIRFKFNVNIVQAMVMIVFLLQSVNCNYLIDGNNRLDKFSDIDKIQIIGIRLELVATK